MLLITIFKTIITLHPYRVRCVLSSLCFGTALGEVLTVFGGLDCTFDVGTLYYVFRTVFTTLMCPVVHLC